MGRNLLAHPSNGGRRLALVCAVVLTSVAVIGGVADAQEFKFEVTLKKAWVEACADRATIDASMSVRHSHHRANTIKSGGDDGDIHFSGESDDVGLPFVAEVVNAAGQPDAKAVILAHEGSEDRLAVTGAWRLWFEHPSASQVQGDDNPFEPDHTNPDHSFEIHPASMVGTTSVLESFVDVLGYTAYTADVAVTYFEGQEVEIKASGSGITIRSKKLKYNYVDLEMELTTNPTEVADGYIALATIHAEDDEQITASARRMIFVAGTDGANQVKDLGSGDRLHVLAIPRINLNAVLALVQANGTEQFRAKLPYEMIVVGVR